MVYTSTTIKVDKELNSEIMSIVYRIMEYAHKQLVPHNRKYGCPQNLRPIPRDLIPGAILSQKRHTRGSESQRLLN